MIIQWVSFDNCLYITREARKCAVDTTEAALNVNATCLPVSLCSCACQILTAALIKLQSSSLITVAHVKDLQSYQCLFCGGSDSLLAHNGLFYCGW